jgi:hypothetical protein
MAATIPFWTFPDASVGCAPGFNVVCMYIHTVLAFTIHCSCILHIYHTLHTEHMYSMYKTNNVPIHPPILTAYCKYLQINNHILYCILISDYRYVIEFLKIEIICYVIYVCHTYHNMYDSTLHKHTKAALA